MALKTTCLGAYPKPDWLPVRDWFQIEEGHTKAGSEVTKLYSATSAEADAEFEALLDKATGQAVADQVECGIDIVTDGEQRRENYIHYHCRHLNGFDFENLTRKVLRSGAYETELPTIRSKVEPAGDHFLDHDWRIAQNFPDHPVKLTVPGPITIMDTTANAYYDDDRQLAFDLADALNYEIRALADAGCKHIQVDEPLFARKPAEALAYGIDALERCFDGVPDDVTRVVHMCCGYPNHLDDTTYLKADKDCYFQIADAMDASSIHQLSLEDAHRHNDLSLFDHFKRITIVFGAIAIARSRVEPVEEIVARLKAALEHIDHDRVVVAPDCGLGFLGRDLAMTKLKNMAAAAREV
jgi:5-methyltetrahydropteroyltriglutamate--homocysteine methyltransferase